MDKKTALVTGAGAGIGQGIALELAAKGYKVYANARSEESVKETLEKGHGRGLEILPLLFDVSVQSQVRDKISSLERIDCLVNNAAISFLRTIEDTTEEDWDVVLNTNVKGYFFCSKYALPKMGRGSSIINLSSGAAKTGGAIVSIAYSASKGAINTMTLSFATRLASQGIRVNAISPGFVDTKMLAVNDTPLDYYKSVIPLGFLGTVEDIAALAYYLASDCSRYMTGQIIEINGGDIMG